MEIKKRCIIYVVEEQVVSTISRKGAICMYLWMKQVFFEIFGVHSSSLEGIMILLVMNVFWGALTVYLCKKAMEEDSKSVAD